MSTLFYIQASWQRKAFKYNPPSQQLTWHNHDKGNFKTSHSVIHIQRQIRFFKRSPFRYNSENVVLRSHMYITLYKWSRKLVFGSLSAMCTASGDVGWFSIKHKSQGQHLYVKHGTSVQRRVFFLQADLHHAQYPCIHTCTQTSNQQVVCDKEHFGDKVLNSSTLNCGLRMHVAGWGITVILLFTITI